MRLLVTGGAGYLGSEVCRQAVEAGHDVIAIQLRKPAPFGRALTVVYYVRTLALRWLDLPAGLLRQCQQSWGMTDLDKLPSSGECALTLLVFGAVVSVVSALMFARSEFRVKTPGSD